MTAKPFSIPGFSTDLSGREAPCIGIFGEGGVGKSRLMATATQYALERDKIPGWLVFDRKTRRTIRETCDAMGLPYPLINDKDFIESAELMRIAKLEREAAKDSDEIQKIYSSAMRRVTDAALSLISSPKVEPVLIETGTQVWDWISYAHFGRKQGVGKSRVWGPPKQDWTDLMDALSSKTLILSFWEREAWSGDDRAGYTIPDGPPHVDYTTTTLVRLRVDRKKKLKAGESFVDRFELDIYKSQENKSIEGERGILTGEGITYENLLSLLGV